MSAHRSFFSAVFAIAFLLDAAPAAAQEDPIPISLEEALARLSANSLELRLARSRVDEAAALARQAGAYPNPTFSLTHEPLSGNGSDYSESYLNLSQQVEFGAVRSTRRAVAEGHVAVAITGVQVDSFAVASAVKRIYVDGQEVEAQRSAIGRLAEVFSDAEAAAAVRYAEGDLSLYDYRRIQLQERRYQRLLSELDVQGQAAAWRLAALIAPEQPGVAFAASDPLGSLPPAVLAIPRDAESRRPEVRAAQAELRLAEAEVQAARAERIPMPTLIAGFKRQSDDLNGAFLGLSFPIPAFDRNAGAIEGASAGSRWAAERLTLTRSKVRAEVEIALSRYRAFRAIAASGTLGAGEGPMELLDIALLAYAEGEAGLLDLLDAAEAVREAVVADVRLRADVWIAYYDLERALGGIAPEVPQPNEEQDR